MAVRNKRIYAFIYVLHDLHGHVFYVGCTTCSLNHRLANHISSAKGNYKNTNKAKNEKIASLNYNVFIRKVDCIYNIKRGHVTPDMRADMLERKWIRRYINKGTPLLNGLVEIKMAFRHRKCPQEYKSLFTKSSVTHTFNSI